MPRRRQSVVLPREIDFANAAQVSDWLTNAVNQAGQQLELDFSKVSFMDSTAIGVLIAIRRYATGRQVELKLTNVSGNVLRILTIAGVGANLGLETPDELT